MEGIVSTQIFRFGTSSVELDEDGFLIRSEDWSEEIAQALGRADGVELGAAHMEVLRFMREYFIRFEVPPMPRYIAKGLDKIHHTDTYSVRYLYSIFPAFNNACRYAGIKPLGCT